MGQRLDLQTVGGTIGRLGQIKLSGLDARSRYCTINSAKERHLSERKRTVHQYSRSCSAGCAEAFVEVLGNSSCPQSFRDGCGAEIKYDANIAS